MSGNILIRVMVFVECVMPSQFPSYDNVRMLVQRMVSVQMTLPNIEVCELLDMGTNLEVSRSLADLEAFHILDASGQLPEITRPPVRQR